MKLKKLSIIMPVFNEGGTILLVLKRVMAVKVPNMTKQLIIIDDGSTDDTWKYLQRLNEKSCIVIRHPRNLGKGISGLLRCFFKTANPFNADCSCRSSASKMSSLCFIDGKPSQFFIHFFILFDPEFIF